MMLYDGSAGEIRICPRASSKSMYECRSLREVRKQPCKNASVMFILYSK